MGLGHKGNVRELTECKYPITNTHNGSRYVFYNDAGWNYEGQCGMGESIMDVQTLTKFTHFEKLNVDIKQICASFGCDLTFFTTKDNKLYGCGWNLRNELGLQKMNLIYYIDQSYMNLY